MIYNFIQFQTRIKSSIESHHEASEVLDEVEPRDSDNRAQERDPGARNHPGRGRGHEHSSQDRQDDSEEQGPRHSRPAFHQRKQHQILHSARDITISKLI